MLSKEELLKPRYKVIADYPKSIHKVGTVYDCGGSSEDMLYADTDGPRMRAYPHLFKKLEWWEERDEKDMPEYLKYKSKIIKIDKWFYMANDLRFHSETTFITSGPYGSLPATREEYEKYLQSKK